MEYYNVQPTLNHLRVFGSLGYCYIPIQLRVKDNSPIREEGILLGYAPGHARNYIMYIPTLNQYIVTDKVEFYENDENKNVELRKLELLRGVATEVPVQDVSRDPDEYKYLIGTLHFDSDDHKIYKIKRVVVENEFIVGYRQAVTRSGRGRGAEDDTPIFIEDLARMTRDYNKVLTNANTMIMNQYPLDISMYRDMHQCCASTNLLDRIESCVDKGENIKPKRLPVRTDQLGSRLLESDSTFCDESALIPTAKRKSVTAKRKSDLKEGNDTTRFDKSIRMLEDHSDNTTGSGLVNPTIGLRKSEERGKVRRALSQISSQPELFNSVSSQSLRKGALRKGNQYRTDSKRSYDEITGLSKPHPIAHVLTFNSFSQIH